VRVPAAELVLHLKAGDVAGDLSGHHLRLYRHLRNMAARDGIVVRIRPRDRDIRIGTRTLTDDRFEDGNLHIIDDRSVRCPNVLNAAPADFWEFWHLDPHGTKAFSSTGAKPYDPAHVAWSSAKPFYDRLRAEYLHKRRSKYQQTETRLAVPQGCVAVFFQGNYPIESGATTHSDLDMLHQILNVAGTHPVVVKLHPHTADAGIVAQILAIKDPRLSLTAANVHDVLAACCVSVSINSTVALEGNLHRKPAILFGESDFHHIAYPVARYGVAGAFKAALAHDGGFAKYLTWYFKRNSLWMARRTLDDDIWRIFTAAGFPKSRFAPVAPGHTPR